MKIAFQLAVKNLLGAGLRTWLNVIVLSFSFVIIIFFNGLIDGWNEQARVDGINWEYGNGQLLNNNFDPLDPFSYQDGHAELDAGYAKNLTPVLVVQATLYPEGRMISVVLKGIDPNQHVVMLPTDKFSKDTTIISGIIGSRMAASANLKVGDKILVRWRDKNGTFDAADITISEIFATNVGTVDNGQVWIPINRLWRMTGLENEASYFIANDAFEPTNIDGWKFQSQKDLLKTLTEIIQTKKMSTSIMYILLLAIALLAIFDTQVLSVFCRQKEIGTYISLGMTRMQVVGIFTVEGSMYSLFATVLGAIYGIPLLLFLSRNGIAMPEGMGDMGLAIADKIYPTYSFGLILSTIALVVISATIVSFLPSRKISKMDPVDALKGKVQ